MSKPPSDATLLREAKRVLIAVQKQLSQTELERNNYRARATKAEQELAEWKARFDILLRRESDVRES